VNEALAVRNSVGIFDVSHMGRALVRGHDSRKFLDAVTTNDVSSLRVGEGHYSLFCNELGGIKDDLLVFRLTDCEYMIIYNAANRSKDFDWLSKNAMGDVELRDVSDQVAMFALQGPKAIDVLRRTVAERVEIIPRFSSVWSEIAGAKTLLTRTGYTGEDGFEIFVFDSPVTTPQIAVSVWEKLMETGKINDIEPCGLGARDLLRLEAGLCLYGTDMDESTNPYEAKLGFVVKLHKDFIGKSTLQDVKQKGTERTRVGLVTVNRVIPRHSFKITHSGEVVGEVTSGSLSPILDKGIAMGYVPTTLTSESFGIRIRDRIEEARLVKTPFYDTSKYGYSRRQAVQTL
jgi:aminomethyltransferase